MKERCFLLRGEGEEGRRMEDYGHCGIKEEEE
jgi:hypothetical protein